MSSCIGRLRQRMAAMVQERGNNLVESAIVMPLLIILLLGTVDVGMGFKTYLGLTNAAREGARWLSSHPDDVPGTYDRISNEVSRIGLSMGEIGSDVAATITPEKSSYAAGDEVNIVLSYDYQLLFGSITGVPNIPFSARATMVVLYDGS